MSLVMSHGQMHYALYIRKNICILNLSGTGIKSQPPQAVSSIVWSYLQIRTSVTLEINKLTLHPTTTATGTGGLCTKKTEMQHTNLFSLH